MKAIFSLLLVVCILGSCKTVYDDAYYRIYNTTDKPLLIAWRYVSDEDTVYRLNTIASGQLDVLTMVPYSISGTTGCYSLKTQDSLKQIVVHQINYLDTVNELVSKKDVSRCDQWITTMDGNYHIFTLVVDKSFFN